MSKENLEILTRGAEEIIPEESFLKQIKSKKKLRVKAGFDPTSPDLHLGHTVLLNKMKIFGRFVCSINIKIKHTELIQCLNLESIHFKEILCLN